MRKGVLGLLAGLCALIPAPALGQNGLALVIAEAGDVESGQPLIGAEVRLLGTPLRARTAAIGVARIAGVSPGTYTVQLRMLGYEPISAPILVGPGDSVDVVLLARPAPSDLDTVRVTARRRLLAADFERRRTLGIGHYFTADDLASDIGRDLGNTLESHLPGVQMVWDLTRNRWILTSRRGFDNWNARPCAAQVILDGTFLTDPDFTFIQVSDLAGIEYYDGTDTPAELRRAGSRCGVLVLWTKQAGQR